MTPAAPDRPHGRRDDPSLLRFLLDRIDEDLFAANAGRGERQTSTGEFAKRFQAGHMMRRAEQEARLVETCVELMRQAPGQPPGPPVDPPDPVTVLGSMVLKRLAARYHHHPDYQPHWAPD